MNNEFYVSEGLSRELAVRADKSVQSQSALDASQTFSGYITASNKSHMIEQVDAATKGWIKGARVLDVGFGNGFSSLHLASIGFRVIGVEPSKPDIDIALKASQKFALQFDAVCSTGEEMDSALSEGVFDYVLFNSSLHHCDDPVKSLRAAFRLLKPGGVVTCIEPALKPWRSKSWFYRELERDPVKMGHYGGNEHTYYSWEYAKMLETAGFSCVQSRPALSLNDSRTMLLNKLQAKTSGRYMHSIGGIAARAVYYAVAERLFMSRTVTSAFMRLSLGDGIWTAQK